MSQTENYSVSGRKDPWSAHMSRVQGAHHTNIAAIFRHVTQLICTLMALSRARISGWKYYTLRPFEPLNRLGIISLARSHNIND